MEETPTHFQEQQQSSVKQRPRLNQQMTFKIQPNIDAGNKTENTGVEPSSKSTEREKENANVNENSSQNIKQDRPRISV